MIQKSNDSSQLPQSWAWTTLSEIGEVITGTTPKKACQAYYGPNYPFFKPTDLNAGYYTNDSLDHLSQLGIKQARLLPEKAILVTCIGATIGKTGFIRASGACNQQINAVIARKGVLPEFIYFWSISAAFQKQINKNASATTLPILNKSKFEQLLVPLAPFKEQARIVQKVEELFSFLDAGTEELRKIQAQLKRYRQAVLKHAFEGKLTQQWRQIHKEELELPENLAERVTTAKARFLGKKFKDPPKIEKKSLPAIPSEWCWQNFSLVIKRVKRGPSLKCNQNAKGIRYITSGNLQEGKLRLDLDYKFLENFTDIEKCRLLPKDLIFNCVNSLEQIGKSAVFEKEHRDAIVGFNNYALELDRDFIIPEYANAMCQSDFFKKQVYFLIKRAVNQVSFATRELDFMAVPLPTLNEQTAIINEIERYLSMLSKTNSDLETSLKLTDRLRQSILKLAFEGKLVSQDPRDESAGKLLERIKAERLINKSKNNSQVEMSCYVK